MRLQLYKNVTPDMLLNAGFKGVNMPKSVFRFQERLYKNIISLCIKINLNDEEMPIEWSVMDTSTYTTYNAFYYTPNMCTDLVKDHVTKKFNEIIETLQEQKILYVEE